MAIPLCLHDDALIWRCAGCEDGSAVGSLDSSLGIFAGISLGTALTLALLGALRRTWWAVAVVLVFWATAAKVFHAYILYPWLDMPTHFAGGMAIAYFFSALIDESALSLGPTPRPVRLTAAVALTAFAAVTWEILEFLSDRFLHSHLNLGVSDTLSDLCFGILGGMAAVLVIWVGERRTGGLSQ